MKICYLTLAKFPSRAANVIQVLTVAGELAGLGHRVTVSGAGDTPPATADERQVVNYSLIRWPGRFWGSVRLRLRARWILATQRPDLVITREPVLASIASDAGHRVILEMHGIPRAGTRAHAALARAMGEPRVVRIISISHALQADLVETFGAPSDSERLKVLHDGATPAAEPAPMPCNDPPIAGYFGHLYPGKGMELIAELAPLCPEIAFEIYGGQAADVERWQAATGDLPNITIHGYIDHVQVRAAAERCDLLLAPYASEVRDVGGRNIGRWMSPLKIFEYMATGRPIMTSDLPVLSEVLTDGETAIMCQPSDVSDWASRLKRVAADPDMAARIGAAGRALLCERYSWQRRTKAMLEGLE